MKLWQLLFSFHGRMDRRQYWLVQLLLTLITVALIAWDLQHALQSTVLLTPDSADPDALALGDPLALLRTGLHFDALDTALTLLLTWPFVATQVKRFHDTNRSGWWTLINVLPVIGPLWTMIVTGFFRGTEGPNRYGP